jgi:tRNA(Ile2) C34 agmatinyltransferase TiaS
MAQSKLSPEETTHLQTLVEKYGLDKVYLAARIVSERAKTHTACSLDTRCPTCGSAMIPSGSCHRCENCGSTSGCS